MDLGETLSRRKMFKRLLVFQTIYFILSVFIPFLPGWKMFSEVQHPKFRIFKSDGVEINSKIYMPRVAYFVGEATISDLATFICEKEHQSLVLKFEDGRSFAFTEHKCEAEKI
jgi:hypothetical protein